MKGVFKILTEIIKQCSLVFKSKYKWMLLLFILWVLRVSCIPADIGGIARVLQVVTILGLLYYAMRFIKFSVYAALFKTKSPNVTLACFLLLALISTFWSYVPMMTFFMAFEKLSFMIIFYALFSQCYTFQSAERLFVYLMVGLLVINGIVSRIMGYQPFVGHDLQQGSCAAMCFSYCCGEFFAKKINDRERYTMLKGAILISLLFLIISTSGGANASAALGFCVALFMSRKFGWGLLLFIFCSAVYFFNDLGKDIFNFLMAGKSESDIRSSTGRTSIWSVVDELGKQKPLFGWGYAALERYITDKSIMSLTDLHSNFYGAYGNLGLIGLGLLIIHHISAIYFTFCKTMKPGYVGLLCAICCGTLNGYSYGFLVGKTAIISSVYIAILMMTYIYSKIRFYSK